jgi:hypothetical protein
MPMICAIGIVFRLALTLDLTRHYFWDSQSIDSCSIGLSQALCRIFTHAGNGAASARQTHLAVKHAVAANAYKRRFGLPWTPFLPRRGELEARPARAILARMAGHVVIRITERLGGGEPIRTAYAVAEPNEHRAIALFKLRPDHTADEQVEAVAELTQSALDSLGLKPGMIKPL